MRVLVTGGTGFLGGHLVRALLARGDTVRVLSRRPDPPVPAGVEVARGDVRDPATVGAAVEGVEAVAHLAASIAVAGREDPAMHPINVEGPTHVAAACRAAGARLLHVSSVHALCGRADEAPVTERSALAVDAARPPYDRSKALGERAVLTEVERGLDARILSPVGVLGPGDAEPSPIGAALLQMARGELPALIGSGFWWVDVRDVAEAALRALDRPEPGARYLVSAGYATTPDLARWVHAAGGARPPRLVCPLWLAAATAPLAVAWARLLGRRALYSPDAVDALRHHQALDDTWTRAALGLSPRPVERAVTDAMAWFRAEGRL